MAQGQTAADFREVTPAEKEKIAAQDAKWTRPPQWLIDRFNTKAMIWTESWLSWDWQKTGGYNESTGFFELNLLKDITTAQAMDIDALGVPFEQINQRYNAVGYRAKARTVFRPYEKSNWNFTLNSCFHGSELESIILPKARIAGNMSMSRLRFLYCSTINDNTVTDYMPNLEIFRCEKLTRGVHSFRQSANLTVDSVSHIVTRIPTATTVTSLPVHANVLAKLTGNTANAAAAALSKEELAKWAEVAHAAAEKNIVFTT